MTSKTDLVRIVVHAMATVQRGHEEEPGWEWHTSVTNLAESLDLSAADQARFILDCHTHATVITGEFVEFLAKLEQDAIGG